MNALDYLYARMSRHLVCLAAAYLKLDTNGNPTGEQDVYAYTSFVYVHKGEWYLITAGHILEQIESYQKFPKGVLKVYLTCFPHGNEAVVRPVHFADFDEAQKSRTYDENAGLDYGWVYLRPYYRPFLEKDSILPVGEKDWAMLNARKYELEVEVGFPEAFLGQTVHSQGMMEKTIEPLLMSINRLKNPPSDLAMTQYARFIGEIHPDGIDKIVGMSGGPIFGFGKDSEGTLRYWLLALQSKRHKKHQHVAFGCLAEVFMPKIVDEIERKP
ncbi:MAG: hypothetical protein HY040_15625 [Planctomycetes bacterium]|nr:hypothetical protein [Planctomycetota bacterium]